MANKKKRGYVSFTSARLTSIISIALSLYLLGLVFLVGMTGNQLATFVKENISFSIIIKDSQKEADIIKLRVNSTNYRL